MFVGIRLIIQMVTNAHLITALTALWYSKFPKVVQAHTLGQVDILGIVSFYRAMHFSAYARSWDRMSSVRLSVRPSVRLSVCDVGDLWSHRLEILETNCTDN